MIGPHHSGGGRFRVRLSVPGRSICRMATPCVRDAAAVANEAIRVFMVARAGRPLWPEEQDEYEQLLAAWAEAARP